MHAKQFWGVVMSTLLTAVAYADHDFVRPLNIQLFALADNVPAGCARFFSATGWGDGAWDENRPHELYVTFIDFDYNAEVLYGFGGWSHDATGEWLTLSGTIRGNQLMIPMDVYAAHVIYGLSSNGERLSGKFKSRDAKRTATVALTRL